MLANRAGEVGAEPGIELLARPAPVFSPSLKTDWSLPAIPPRATNSPRVIVVATASDICSASSVLSCAVDTVPVLSRVGVPDVQMATLTDFVLDSCDLDAVIYTDHWVGCNDLENSGFTHVKTNISASGDPTRVAMPCVHRVASLMKRWLLGTHQGGVSLRQLDFYLDEFVFRFNRRRSKSRGLLFHRLMEQAVITTPKPAQTIIGGRP